MNLLALHTNCATIDPVPTFTDLGANMSDSTFDPKAIFEAYRNAFAPALKAQQDGVKIGRASCRERV